MDAEQPVVAQKARGRPKVQECGTTLSVWVPVTAYDRLCQVARQRDLTVSSLAKHLLMLRLK